MAEAEVQKASTVFDGIAELWDSPNRHRPEKSGGMAIVLYNVRFASSRCEAYKPQHSL